jgi:mediator of RNA polymerase II transcription subunit 6
MEQAQDVHLEEVFWRSPQHVQMMGGFLHSNNSKLKTTQQLAHYI